MLVVEAWLAVVDAMRLTVETPADEDGDDEEDVVVVDEDVEEPADEINFAPRMPLLVRAFPRVFFM